MLWIFNIHRNVYVEMNSFNIILQKHYLFYSLWASCYSYKSIFLHLLSNARLTHIIRHSSVISDNHKGGKILERQKLLAHQLNHEWKLTKQSHSSTSAVSCAKSRIKENDRFKLHKLNIMKTTFYITIQILKLTITS